MGYRTTRTVDHWDDNARERALRDDEFSERMRSANESRNIDILQELIAIRNRLSYLETLLTKEKDG